MLRDGKRPIVSVVSIFTILAAPRSIPALSGTALPLLCLGYHTKSAYRCIIVIRCCKNSVLQVGRSNMISFLMSDEEWIAIGDMEESEFESFGKERLGMNFRADSEGNPGSQPELSIISPCEQLAG